VRGERVTPASDVYSLGVILYELLSGQRPYRVRSASPSDIERAMFERDLEAPSTASGRTERRSDRGGTGTLRPTPAVISARRQLAPGKLRRRLRGDLDNVVLKALRREKDERYATAAELREDIRRHLEGFPVRARAGRRGYRAAKFMRRHRTAVTAAAAAVLSLIVGLGAAVRQARVAEAERQRAEARFQDVRRLANSVIYELHDSIANLQGATTARRLLVTRALEYLDRLASEAREDLALKRELADAYQRVGQVQGGGVGANLGDTAGALASYGKALAIRQSLAALNRGDPRDVLGLALLEFDLGALRRALGQLSLAERFFLSSAARLEALMKQGALPDGQRQRLGAVYQRLAEVQSFQGKREAALASAHRAAAAAETVWRARPEEASARSIMAAASFQLAEALADQDRHAEALERTRQARALLEAALRENPLDAQQTRILLFVLNGEGRYLWTLGDLPGAVKVCRHALDVAEEAWRRDPRDRWSQMGVAVAARTLGSVLLKVGDTDESIRRFRQALRLTTQALVEDPQFSVARLESASAEHGLGRALLARGNRESTAEGCATLERVRAFWTALRKKGDLPPGEATELDGLPRLLAPCRSRHQAAG
jgi:non-specific serine/threonine protein kinase/serine/threonine-protein kinase